MAHYFDTLLFSTFLYMHVCNFCTPQNSRGITPSSHDFCIKFTNKFPSSWPRASHGSLNYSSGPSGLLLYSLQHWCVYPAQFLRALIIFLAALMFLPSTVPQGSYYCIFLAALMCLPSTVPQGSYYLPCRIDVFTQHNSSHLLLLLIHFLFIK